MGLNHFDQEGNAWMVDVSSKPETARIAMAEGFITMNEEAFALVKQGGNKKGDILGVARIAAIMSAKKTSDLIPLCHNINLTNLKADFTLIENERACRLVVTAKTTGVTGVEMEAIVGVSIGLATVYDMLKATDRGMVIYGIRLLEKDGGKSGHYKA